MTEQATPKRVRSRGRGFPSLPLDEAADAVRDAGKYGREHNLSAFAQYLGHETTNSGAFKAKIASMKDWGLVRVEGSRVVLTDLANRIAHPTSSDGGQAHLRDAFRNDELFGRVLTDSARGVELSLEHIGSRAVNDWGVSPQSKEKFARSFAQSVVAAGLGRTAAGGAIELFGDDSNTVEPELNGAAGAEGSADAAPPGGTKVADSAGLRPGRHAVTPALHQEWEVDGGLLTFEAQLDRPLPPTSFIEIAAVAEAVEKLAQKLRSPAPDPDGAS